jgi:molecular chaperone DnaK (HSP70)
MSSFVVGIDLGTTNTVVAQSPRERVDVSVFPLNQVVSPGEVSEREQLPSSLYLPAKDEVRPGDTRLPWHGEGDEEPGYFLGTFAATHGMKVPGRLVTSAKSWLSYARVDRTAPILPWGAVEDVPRLSPVEAAKRVLSHVRAAWDHAHADAPLAEQEVILTVPASFDEVARELTVRAAREAGLARLRLLEEPQAALYDFLHTHDKGLSRVLEGVRLVLVVDVGGGTTDLTLVQVSQRAGETPSFERVAVGEHLMLGGDNMDLALARHVEKELTGTLGSLSAAQWGSLGQSARLAKESLLSTEPPEEYGVALVGRGARLVGAAQTHNLSRAKAVELLIDGFFPFTAPDEAPLARERAGFTELSLPYAQDAAIPRHVAAFLRRHERSATEAGARSSKGLPRPDAVLLNGGVFQSALVRERFAAVLERWYGEPVPFLGGASLDAAVARGAASYGLVREGKGVRIKGGSARTYFIGVEGEGGKEQALCVVPRGVEEGERYSVDKTFRLVLGKPVSFNLYTSTSDASPRVGEVVALHEGLTGLPPMATVLKAPSEVPVRLQVELTEVGTLQVSLAMTEEALTGWDLDFSTRALAEDPTQSAEPVPAMSPAMQKKLEDAKGLLEDFFGSQAKKDVDPRQVKNIRPRLEAMLGPRDEWPIALCRELFGVLIAGKKKRRRTVEHERVYFHLAGHLLRPGTGAPLDDWRMQEVWELFGEGVQYVKEKKNWSAWWLLWRRVAGGLCAEQQEELLEAIRYWVLPQSMREGKAPKGPKPHGVDEMVRLAASLERLPKSHKEQLGVAVLHMLQHKSFHSWWPMGRLGARHLLLAEQNHVVPPEVAAGWLAKLLDEDWEKAEGAAFAATQMARMTGDRSLDVSDELRAKVVRGLTHIEASDTWIRMVREVVALSSEENASILGESMPVGLKLGA